MSEYQRYPGNAEPTWGFPPTGPSGARAGFWRRFAAWLIDLIIVGVIQAILTPIGNGGRILSTLVSLAYVIGFFGAPRGQTPGYMLLGIRVTSIDGTGPIGYGRAAIRWLVSIPSGILLGIGFFWMIWDREKQTWYDKASTSVVVPVSSNSLR
jgi:uncharacterized RDD family membrane protein YckC